TGWGCGPDRRASSSAAAAARIPKGRRPGSSRMSLTASVTGLEGQLSELADRLVRQEETTRRLEATLSALARLPDGLDGPDPPAVPPGRQAGRADRPAPGGVPRGTGPGRGHGPQEEGRVTGPGTSVGGGSRRRGGVRGPARSRNRIADAPSPHHSFPEGEARH